VGFYQLWVAREVFNKEVLERLLFLLRIEVEAFDRWHSGHISWNIEHSLTSERLEQLNRCVPPIDRQGFKECLHNTAQLGYEVCTMLGKTLRSTMVESISRKIVSNDH